MIDIIKWLNEKKEIILLYFENSNIEDDKLYQNLDENFSVILNDNDIFYIIDRDIRLFSVNKNQDSLIFTAKTHQDQFEKFIRFQNYPLNGKLNNGIYTCSLDDELGLSLINKELILGNIPIYPIYGRYETSITVIIKNNKLYCHSLTSFTGICESLNLQHKLIFNNLKSCIPIDLYNYNNEGFFNCELNDPRCKKLISLIDNRFLGSINLKNSKSISLEQIGFNLECNIYCYQEFYQELLDYLSSKNLSNCKFIEISSGNHCKKYIFTTDFYSNESKQFLSLLNEISFNYLSINLN